MRRLLGIDLNGWHDFGCRDWHVDDPDDNLADPIIVDGGFGSVVVTHEGTTVGGPQAILSPVGRGGGWGEVGAAEKRRAVAHQWQAFLAGKPPSGFGADIRAAVDALSVSAEGIVLCMPDRPEMSEARQQILLAAFSGRRQARVMLLWRPVAMILGLLTSDILADADEGYAVLCLLHTDDGFEVQRLVLRRLADRPEYLAPERAEVGRILCQDIGLTRFAEHAKAKVEAANPHLALRPTEEPRLPFHLLFEDPAPIAEEIVRRNNGNWTAVQAQSEYSLPNISADFAIPASDADLVILMSPLAERHRIRLVAGLSGQLGATRFHVADPYAAARGALEAARRIERGIPHYLDRLDQISLAVSRRTGPVFVDLIPANATVPGNREYVSEPITSMVWPIGMKQANFYIRKGPKEIRHWETPAVQAPSRNESLEVRLRQMPAQGWAKLTVTAPEWEHLRQAPIQLDWNGLRVDPRNEAEILAALERPRPVVPERVRYQANIGLWDGSLRTPGVSAALRPLNLRIPDTLKRLADTLSASYRLDGRTTVFPVGTDGDLPHDLDDATRARFEGAMMRISDDLLKSIGRGSTVLDNNHALRCLTWVFALCPEEIQEALGHAVDSIQDNQGPQHPFLTPQGGGRVVVHGLGRVVTSPDLLRRFIPKLYGAMGRPNFLGALASMLSRPDATPQVLLDRDVTNIARQIVRILEDLSQQHKFGVTFKYALMVVAGILRVRERDPWALLAGESAEAQALVEVLSDILASIRSMPGAIPNEAEKLRIAQELIALLSGQGGRPDILTIMDAMAED